MHITTICPRCGTRFQVDSTLCGQRMRCPEKWCRQIFEVRASDPNARPTPLPQSPAPSDRARNKDVWLGSVGEMLPVLPVEQIQEEPNPPVPDLPLDAVQTDASHVEDVIPLLPVEAVEPESPTFDTVEPIEEEPQVASWQEPPPVRGAAPSAPSPSPPVTRRSRSSKTKTPVVRAVPPETRVTPTPKATELEPEPSGPVELPPGAWDAPPVRSRDEQPEPPTATESTEQGTPLDEEGPSLEELEVSMQRRKKRRARFLIVGIVVGVLAILGGVGGFVWRYIAQTEDRLYEQALKAYDEESFVVAAGKFEKLGEAFPESARADQYRFLVDLSRLRSRVSDVQVDTNTAFDEVSEFLKSQRTNPLLKERARDLGTTVVKRLERFNEAGLTQPEESLGDPLARAEKVLGELRASLPDAITNEERTRLEQGFAQVQARIVLAQKLDEALKRLEALTQNPSAEAIKRARQMLRAQASALPTFEKHPRTVAALQKLDEGHLQSVRFLPAENAPPPLRSTEDEQSDLVVDAPLVKQPGVADSGDLVFAQARGVLYALSASTGATRWARRVGIDTAQLPIRLRPTPAVPTERLLVLTTDPPSLTALDLQGKVLWRRRLDFPCVSRPIVKDQTAFLPTYDGQVYEVELVRGRLLGRYHLGQRLSVGGVLDPHTNLLYIPADDLCVYVLDVVKRSCQTILYSNHPSGSLRGEPLVLEAGEIDHDEGRTGAPSYLVLQQTSGLDATQLRVYALPLQKDSIPLAMEPEPRLRGWTWFTPYNDNEKVVMLSDAGAMGLFGIRQVNNRDNPLFPIIPVSPRALEERLAGVDLREYLGAGLLDPREKMAGRGRGQVVDVEGADYWVLAEGRLQRLQMRFTGKEGPRLVPAWASPLALGSPLHRSQRFQGRDQSALVIVTQSVNGHVCLATAIDPDALEDGTAGRDRRIQWQRQLGLLASGDPVALGNQVLVLDQGGGLNHFSPSRFQEGDAPTRWLSSSQLLASALDPAADRIALLLPSLDGKQLFQIGTAAEGTRLLLRRYSAPSGTDDENPEGMLSDEHVDLPRGTHLAGTPAIVGAHLLVPLSDGTLVRYTLPLGETRVAGPNWRARAASTGALCHVVAVGGDIFVTTDGRRGLTCWNWKEEFYKALPENKPKIPACELPERLAGTPVVLTRADSPTGLQLCVADVRGGVTLLKGEALQVERRWVLNGTITAGPFVRKGRIGCVVDRQRLVWLDPARPTPEWEFHTPGDGIVGAPNWIEDLIVVADETGRFVGLDPQTGRPVGPGYTLKATAAPIANPVSFGAGRIFAPLTDGTIMLLSLESLRSSWWEKPLWQGIDAIPSGE